MTSQENIDERRRHFLLMSTKVLSGIGIACALTPFVRAWFPSAKATASGTPVYVDLTPLQLGQQLIVVWRGKPVWVIRRTPAMLKALDYNQSALSDPDSLVKQQPHYAQNKYRSIQPEYVVLVGICTHLGCSPKYEPDVNTVGPEWQGGFYCPCHGSTFDLAGRVFKHVPAPINLEVPPHRFIGQHTIVIGEDESTG